MAYTIAREPFADAQPGIESLARAHWDEIESDEDTFDIDWDLLQSLCDLNALITITVRDEHDTFVGYALYVIAPMTHSYGVIAAVQDSLYIRPDHRKGSLGIRFLRESEDILKAAGASEIVQNTRTSSENLDAVLARVGYTLTGSTYTKKLGGA